MLTTTDPELLAELEQAKLTNLACLLLVADRERPARAEWSTGARDPRQSPLESRLTMRYRCGRVRRDLR